MAATAPSSSTKEEEDDDERLLLLLLFPPSPPEAPGIAVAVASIPGFTSTENLKIKQNRYEIHADNLTKKIKLWTLCECVYK